jgi:radical SAM protein with 4Fe4S-binding SPASM domain
MGQTIRRKIKTAKMLYEKKGIKGFCNGVLSKSKTVACPVAYKNRYFSKVVYPKLSTVFLELTNKCNLKCKMCNWQVRDSGFMSRQLFESCIDQFSDMGLDVLNLQFGGESLLHPEFKDFLKYAISHRGPKKIRKVGWTTNGMLFNQAIADLVVSLDVDWINFSLDGVGQVNDEIRLGSKYSVIEKNIKYLLERRGSSKRPSVLINVVDYGKTDEQKTDIYREWVFQVDEIELLPSIREDNTWENRELISQKHKLAPPPKFCNSPLDTMIISWDGKITGCCFDSNLSFGLGNANNEPIEQIWKGSKFRELRKAVLTNKLHNGSPCYLCEFWKVNFDPKYEKILDGRAAVEYGYVYRRIRKIT